MLSRGDDPCKVFTRAGDTEVVRPRAGDTEVVSLEGFPLPCVVPAVTIIPHQAHPLFILHCY